MRQRKVPSPLNEARLMAIALRYVERYATTRAKLRSYLQRKLRERGWEGDKPADADRIVERFAAQGYVDDAAFALSKSRSLTARGYGKDRVVKALRVAGIEEEDGEAARDLADAEAVDAALRFAERRRLGPFATAAADDPRVRQKALGVMLRAGHPFGLCRAILALRPGDPVDREELSAG
jgi:regulatory protein